MTNLAERAAAAAGRTDQPDDAGTPLDWNTMGSPTTTAAPAIPEPGPEGPANVAVHIAWSRVMGEVRNIGKDKWHGDPRNSNSFQFRGIDAVLDAFGPACRLHGVLVLPVRTETAYRDVKTSTGKNSRECTVVVSYRIIGPAGDHLDVQSAGEAMDSADKGTAKALSTALRSLLLHGGLVPSGDPDPESSTVERGEAPVRSALSYLDEITHPGTSAGRLRQIHHELKSTGQLGALVTNETGSEEPIGDLVVRIGKERAGGES